MQQYSFPTDYAFELWAKFKADGTEMGDFRTVGNLRWAIPANRRYNGNPGPEDWRVGESNRTLLTTLYQDPTYRCPDGSEVQYDGQNRPYCLLQLTMQPDYDAVITDYDASPKYDIALEVKTINEEYRMDKMSFVPFRYFQPFYQQDDRNARLYPRPPEVDILMQGAKITTPDSATPVYSRNPIAVLHWVDTVYRGIPESEIDAAAYKAAFDYCEQTINYRYGAGVPDDAMGADGEFFARADGRIYEKVSGAWDDRGVFQGDYAWLSSQGTNGVYSVKRFTFNGEIEIGANVEDIYDRIKSCVGDMRRYQYLGKIHYRVGGQDDTIKLDVPEADIWELGEMQPWQGIKERVNKLSARMDQSEEHDWLPDDVEFTDSAAVTRDGELREAQIELDGETNPLRAQNILKTQLGLLRETAVIPIRIGYMASFEQRTIQPLDNITVNGTEHKWNREKMQVIHCVQMRDRTVIALCRKFDASVYAPTLTLPGIQRRPVRYVPSGIPPELTGLRAQTDIDIRHDALRVNTQVRWNPVVAAGTKVAYQVLSGYRTVPSGRLVLSGALPTLRANPTIRYPGAGHLELSGALLTGTNFYGSYLPSGRLELRGTALALVNGRSLFDSSVTPYEDQGVLYAARGLTPFNIGAVGSGADFTTSQTQRYGEWLNFQWGPAWNSAGVRGTKTEAEARSLALQMQRRSDDTLIPILGWTGPNGRHATVWRFGAFAGGNTLFGVDEIGADNTSITSAVMNLTSDQLRDWRLLLRDSAGETLATSFPTLAQDPTEVYQWPVAGMEAFLRTARLADRTVDVLIVDSASRWLEYDHRAVNYFETHYDSGRLVLSGGLPRLTVGTAPTQYLGFWDTSITSPLDKGILYRQSNLQADGSGQTATMVNGVDDGARASGTISGFRSADASGADQGNAAVYLYLVSMDASGVLEFVVSTNASSRTISGARTSGFQIVIAGNRTAGLTFVFYDRGTRTGVTIGPGDITETTWQPTATDSARFTGTVNSTKAAALRTFADGHDTPTTRYDLAVVDTSDDEVDLAGFRVEA